MEYITYNLYAPCFMIAVFNFASIFQVRLNAHGILSIEHKLASSIIFEDIIHEFARKKNQEKFSYYRNLNLNYNMHHVLQFISVPELYIQCSYIKILYSISYNNHIILFLPNKFYVL